MRGEIRVMSEPSFKPNTKSEPSLSLIPPKRKLVKKIMRDHVVGASVAASGKTMMVNDKASAKFNDKASTPPRRLSVSETSFYYQFLKRRSQLLFFIAQLNTKGLLGICPRRLTVKQSSFCREFCSQVTLRSFIEYFVMARYWTKFRESVFIFCKTFPVHIFSMVFILCLMLPLEMLRDQFISYDLPHFVWNGLDFLMFSLSSLILCIIIDGYECIFGTLPQWNPFRILVTVLCGNQVFHAAGLTIGLFRGPTVEKVLPNIYFLLCFPDYCLSSVLPLFVLKRLKFLIFSVNWLLFSCVLIRYVVLGLKEILVRRTYCLTYLETEAEKGKENKENRLLETLETTLEIYLKLKGKISDFLKIVRGKNREEKPLVEFDSTNSSAYQRAGGRDNAAKSFGEDKAVKVYTRRGKGGWHSMKPEEPAKFVELGTDPENEGIISDLRWFVSDKEIYKRFGKAWRRGYFLNDYPGTNRSSLIAAMANSLEFDIDDLDPMGLSSILELRNVVVSINNRSLVAIKDIDHWVGMLPNLNNEYLTEILNRLLLSCGDERIIVLTTMHNHVDRAEADSMHLPYSDLYIHKSSRQPIALPNDGDIVQFDSAEQQSLEGCVQEEKSKDLPRLMQIDGVEQRVTKSPRYLGGFTAKSTSSSRWPIGLPDGRHIVVLNLLEQSTKNVAHVARAEQCSPTVPLPEKKMVRRRLKRKYRIMSVIFAIHQHFGKRCEGTAKSFRATRICRNHGINRVSTVKRIHKQHGINQWPFRQKWATRKGYSLGEKRPYKVSSLSMDLPRSLKMDCSGGLGAQSAVGLPDGGYVLSLSEKKVVGKTLKRKCRTMSLFSLEDHQQHAVRKWGDAAKSLGRKRICKQIVVQHVSRAKRIHRQHGFHRWPFQQNWATMKAYSVGDKRPAEVIILSTDGKLVSRLQVVHISWLVKFLPWPSALRGGGEIVGPIALLSSEFAATNNRAHGIRKNQSGASSASHSEKKRPGEPEDFGERDGIISYEDLQNLFGMNRDDAAKFLDVSPSTLKRICRKHGITQWPYKARKNAVKKPPDRHRGMNTSPACKTLSTNGSNPASSLPKPTISHAIGSSDDRRNLLVSQEEPLLLGYVSGPTYGTISSSTDPAPNQPTPIVPHTTGNLEDQRNLLASQEEALLWGHVSGPIYGTISSCTDPAPSQPTPTGNLEDQRNLLALPEEPLLGQLMPTIPPTMDGFADWSAVSAFFDDSFPEGHASGSIDFTVPACSNQAPSQTMPTNVTEGPNMGFVELKATYGDKTIKFQLPPMFQTSELKEKVSKILECELRSFDVEYEDGDGEWILMACDENVREYLQLLNSLGKQVPKLKISDKVPNTKNSCEFCGSLTRKRPRHVQR